MCALLHPRVHFDGTVALAREFVEARVAFALSAWEPAQQHSGSAGGSGGGSGGGGGCGGGDDGGRYDTPAGGRLRLRPDTDVHCAWVFAPPLPPAVVEGLRGVPFGACSAASSAAAARALSQPGMVVINPALDVHAVRYTTSEEEAAEAEAEARAGAGAEAGTEAGWSIRFQPFLHRHSTEMCNFGRW